MQTVLYGALYEKDKSCRADLLNPSRAGTGVLQTKDGRVEFFKQGVEAFAKVKSPADLPVFYPLQRTFFQGPARAVLLDLDGTTIQSEAYWVDAIRETVAKLLRNPRFVFSPEDLPHVSGYSTREHLEYCLGHYQIDRPLDEAISIQQAVMKERLDRLERGEGSDLLKPSPGLKEFLLELKGAGIKLALVTAASERKAMLEIRLVFRELGLGEPEDFYDTIITAGHSASKGKIATLGSLASKPHPWLYLEAAQVGLGFNHLDRHRLIGIEDSAAGVLSLKLAGFSALGLKEGNIGLSGVRPLLEGEGDTLLDFLPLLLG